MKNLMLLSIIMYTPSAIASEKSTDHKHQDKKSASCNEPNIGPRFGRGGNWGFGENPFEGTSLYFEYERIRAMTLAS